MDKGKGVIGNQLDHADLSKIRILLYDINAESCQEILALLCKCPYQGNMISFCPFSQIFFDHFQLTGLHVVVLVAAVWSAREVYETLKSEGHETHIILAEVNLLMANDARMLRYIMRDKKLQQIPVISK